MFSNALETSLVRYGRFFGESYPQRWHFRAGPLFPGVPQLENVISEGIIHQKIVRSARGMSLEHSKTCGTCSAGVTYSVVNRVWQNAWYWRRYLLLNPHKVEILEILTLICGGPPPWMKVHCWHWPPSRSNLKSLKKLHKKHLAPSRENVKFFKKVTKKHWAPSRSNVKFLKKVTKII